MKTTILVQNDLEKAAKNKYRTLNNAGKVAKMPKKYAIITNSKYKDAISLINNSIAHLHAIRETNKMLRQLLVFHIYTSLTLT